MYVSRYAPTAMACDTAWHALGTGAATHCSHPIPFTIHPPPQCGSLFALKRSCLPHPTCDSAGSHLQCGIHCFLFPRWGVLSILSLLDMVSYCRYNVYLSCIPQQMAASHICYIFCSHRPKSMSSFFRYRIHSFFQIPRDPSLSFSLDHSSFQPELLHAQHLILGGGSSLPSDPAWVQRLIAVTAFVPSRAHRQV